MIKPTTPPMPISMPAPAPNVRENMAFVVRISWDDTGNIGQIVVKPVDDSPLRVFVDLESTIFYLSQLHNKQPDSK